MVLPVACPVAFLSAFSWPLTVPVLESPQFVPAFERALQCERCALESVLLLQIEPRRLRWISVVVVLVRIGSECWGGAACKSRIDEGLLSVRLNVNPYQLQEAHTHPHVLACECQCAQTIPALPSLR